MQFIIDKPEKKSRLDRKPFIRFALMIADDNGAMLVRQEGYMYRAGHIAPPSTQTSLGRWIKYTSISPVLERGLVEEIERAGYHQLLGTEEESKEFLPNLTMRETAGVPAAAGETT